MNTRSADPFLVSTSPCVRACMSGMHACEQRPSILKGSRPQAAAQWLQTVSVRLCESSQASTQRSHPSHQALTCEPHLDSEDRLDGEDD
jgi:hypothetical protein